MSLPVSSPRMPCVTDRTTKKLPGFMELTKASKCSRPDPPGSGTLVQLCLLHVTPQVC